ncbi:hypothetical protein ABB27_11940 [Stenotrophomonas terrae]|uniref:Uncharacterized protein n=1 Tax=Stenotrophomonas terrae TaxID=405446 RepID=A0A0R0CDM5_9GAMM|nr:hypothetical protein ABB27_11940 [Stenotrophomonas terrae]
MLILTLLMSWQGAADFARRIPLNLCRFQFLRSTEIMRPISLLGALVTFQHLRLPLWIRLMKGLGFSF